MTAAAHPFGVLHALRCEPVMRFSSRLTLALAILERAEGEWVPFSRLREEFGCAAPEASHILARMRTMRLVERRFGGGSYRLSDEGWIMQRRIAAILAGQHDHAPGEPPT